MLMAENVTSKEEAEAAWNRIDRNGRRDPKGLRTPQERRKLHPKAGRNRGETHENPSKKAWKSR